MRLVDIIDGLAGCLITVLLIIVIGVLTYYKLLCIIFFYICIGENDKLFRIHKFCGMYPNVEKCKAELMWENWVSDLLQERNDRSNIADFKGVVKLDVRYIKEWGMGMDFQVLNETMNIVLMKDRSM